MVAVTSLQAGHFALLEADLEDHGLTTLGVLLEDPIADRVHVRLRRDWAEIAPDDPVLPALEEDLQAKAEEMGAAKLFAWIEENLSANLRTTARERISVVDFERSLNRLYAQHVRSHVAEGVTHVPRYTLRVAAGRLLENDEVEPDGWEEAPASLRITGDMFAAEIVGDSMEPEISNGSVCLFRAKATGSRQGRLVLVEELGRGGNDRYTVKRYRSEKSSRGEEWRHERIILEPLNPEHTAFELDPEEERYRIVGEFVCVLF